MVVNECCVLQEKSQASFLLELDLRVCPGYYYYYYYYYFYFYYYYTYIYTLETQV